MGRSERREIEIPSVDVEPGDYLLGLGRVESVNVGATKVGLIGDRWRVSADIQHRVVVLRG